MFMFVGLTNVGVSKGFVQVKNLLDKKTVFDVECFGVND